MPDTMDLVKVIEGRRDKHSVLAERYSAQRAASTKELGLEHRHRKAECADILEEFKRLHREEVEN